MVSWLPLVGTSLPLIGRLLAAKRAPMAPFSYGKRRTRSCYLVLCTEKGKLAERRGRKVTGLKEQPFP